MYNVETTTSLQFEKALERGKRIVAPAFYRWVQKHGEIKSFSWCPARSVLQSRDLYKSVMQKRCSAPGLSLVQLCWNWRHRLTCPLRPRAQLAMPRCGIVENRRQRELDPAVWISLERGPMDYRWGIHWDKCPPSSTSPLPSISSHFCHWGRNCSYPPPTWEALSLWNSSVVWDLFGRKLSRAHLSLSASPSRQRRKEDISDINRSKSPYAEDTSLYGGQREAREKLMVRCSAFLHPLSYPLCQVSPKGYSGIWKWCLKGAERKRPIWRLIPFVPRLPSLNTAQMFHLNTQKSDEMQVINLWLWQDYYG